MKITKAGVIDGALSPLIELMYCEFFEHMSTRYAETSEELVMLLREVKNHNAFKSLEWRLEDYMYFKTLRNSSS